MKRVGIYGGSFSPPHIGHYKSALAFYDSLALDEMYILPAGIPPHKELCKDVTSVDRLEMTKLVFSSEKCGGRNITVSSYEIDRLGKSYTYLTLKAFSQPDRQLFMLVGSDMYLTLEEWMHPEIILSLATVVLNRRETEKNVAIFEKKQQELQEKFGAKTMIADFVPYEVSSSEIRAALKRGEKPAALDDDVYRYIVEKELYGCLYGLKIAVSTRLSEKRAAHVCSVEKEVSRMGKLFEMDENALMVLRKAALLHDITHEVSTKEQIVLAKTYKISLSDVDLASPPVLHQFTGAAVANAEFSLSEEGCEAIRCHTTGKPNMSLSDKILCLADYIEETREYPACKALRVDFYSHFTKENKERLIDEVLLRYLENTVEHLQERKATIHPLTLECYNFLKNTLVNYTIL